MGELVQLNKWVPGIKLICLAPHEDSDFTVGKIYKCTYQGVVGSEAIKILGTVRVRDDKRQRRDFNFVPSSKNYLWLYFKPGVL